MLSKTQIVARASLSRIATVALFVIANYRYLNHKPSGALIFTPNPACIHTKFILPFTRWDAAHMLLIAQQGYQTNQMSHAFFPIFPLLMRHLAHLVRSLAPSLCLDEALVLAGLAISNLAFVGAALALHHLTLVILKSAPLADMTINVFCLSPSSAFFSTLYSESLFALCNFSGLLFLETGRPLLASISLMISSATRSNGILAFPIVLYHGILRGNRNSSQRFVCATLHASATILPYAAWQLIGFRRFCTSDHPLNLSLDRPTWCEWRIPHLYVYVQDRYWNVGLFRYWQMRQLPNFLLAAPVLLLSASTCWESCLQFVRRLPIRANSQAYMDYFLRRSPSSMVVPRPGALHPHADMYVLHWAFLSIACFFVLHVQVVTRLVGAGCAPFYWCLADKWLDWERTWKQGGGSIWFGFCLLYAVGGTILHANSYPFV